MITILRQKYEKLVDALEPLLKTKNIGIEIYAEERKDMEKLVEEIRTIQKFLRVEDRT